MLAQMLSALQFAIIFKDEDLILEVCNALCNLLSVSKLDDPDTVGENLSYLCRISEMLALENKDDVIALLQKTMIDLGNSLKFEALETDVLIAILRLMMKNQIS